MHPQAPGQCPGVALRGPLLSLPLESINYPSSARAAGLSRHPLRWGSKLMSVCGADSLEGLQTPARIPGLLWMVRLLQP